MSDGLKKVLDLVPTSGSKEIQTFVPREDLKKILNNGDDYDTVRQNLKDLIEKGQKALDEILGMAEQSQHPRFYEMVATQISTMVAANKALLEATKMQQSIDSAQAEAEEPATEKGAKHVTQNLFVGSTAELQELMKQIKNGN